MAEVVTTIPCPAEGCDETLYVVAGPLEPDDEVVYVPLVLADESRAHLRAH